MQRPDRDERFLLGLLAYGTFVMLTLLVPKAHDLPMLYFSSAVFIGVQLLSKSVRFNFSRLITANNLAMFLYLCQLMATPFLVVLDGAFLCTLPWMPTDAMMNWALFYSTVGYVCYGLGFSRAMRYQYERSVRRREDMRAYKYRRSILIGFVLLGLISVVLNYDVFLAMIQGVDLGRLEIGTDLGWKTLAANLTRACWLFGVVGLYFSWKRGWRGLLIEAPACVFVIALIFCGNVGMNRGSMLWPLFCFWGVLSRGSGKLVQYVTACAVLVFVVALIYFGTVRGSILSGTGDFSSETIKEKTDIRATAQLYFGAPQFVGFLLTIQGQGGECSNYYWGKTIVASILSPVPLVGKIMRDDSGASVYNRLIYGDDADVQDQVIPFTGECALNLGLLGVALGHLLFGAIMGVMEANYLSVKEEGGLHAYFWLYAGVLTGLLSAGSIGVISQFYLYGVIPSAVVLLLGAGRITGPVSRSNPQRT